MTESTLSTNESFSQFVVEIKQAIRQAQTRALQTVNKELISLYWTIGERIVQNQEIHGWGKSVVTNLSEELKKEFVDAKGFSERNLWNMRNYYLAYKAHPKLQTLSAEISWSHNVKILQKLKDPLAQQFYMQASLHHAWSLRILDHQIDNQTYEKTLIGQTNFTNTLPEAIQEQAGLVVKDEYTFDFLELAEQHSEKELETTLNETLKLPDENPSIGIIICKEKSRTTVEFSLKEMNQSIGVATYKLLHELPKEYQDALPQPKEIEQKLSALFWAEE